MSKTWLVARHEYGRHVLRRSFLLALLVVPLVVVVALTVAAFATRAPAEAPLLGLVPVAAG